MNTVTNTANTLEERSLRLTLESLTKQLRAGRLSRNKKNYLFENLQRVSKQLEKFKNQ